MSRYQTPVERTLSDGEAPAENVLGEVGKGFYSAVKGINGARLQISATALGQAQWVLDRSLEFAKDRAAFERPIGANQFVQGMLVESYAELEQARLLLYMLADDNTNR